MPLVDAIIERAEEYLDLFLAGAVGVHVEKDTTRPAAARIGHAKNELDYLRSSAPALGASLKMQNGRALGAAVP